MTPERLVYVKKDIDVEDYYSDTQPNHEKRKWIGISRELIAHIEAQNAKIAELEKRDESLGYLEAEDYNRQIGGNDAE